MLRLRELVAHGGIAPLAALFAIAFAVVELADALAREVVGAVQQHFVGPASGSSGFDLTVWGTTFELFLVAQAAVALLLIGGLLYAVWRLGRSRRQICPECLSEVAREARVCRYCTTDLPTVQE